MPKGKGKTNGRDEGPEQAAQQAGAQQAGEQAQRMPVLGLVVLNPDNGQLMLQINDQAVQDRVAFFLAVAQLGLGNAMSDHAKSQASKILVPKPGIIRPPGL